MFSAFNCRSYVLDSSAGTEQAFLLDDPSVRCWEAGKHGEIVRTAVIFSVVWPIGGTAVCASLLYASRAAIVERKPNPLSRATAFLREFLPECFAYEGEVAIERD